MKTLLHKFQLAFAFIAISFGASATVLITDDFNYTVAQPLATNSGWTSFILQTGTEKSTAVSDVTVADATLQYTGYLSSNVGKAIQIDGLNKDVYRLFPHIVGTTTEAFATGTSIGGRVTTDNSSVYASMLVNVEQAPDGDVKGDCFFGFGSNNWIIGVAGRIYTKKSGAGYVFGVTRVGNGKIVWDATERSLNTTYLVVIKYTVKNGTAPDDRVYMSINPVLGATEPTWIANDATDANGELANLVGAVQFLQQINTSYPTTKSKIKVGGLRVATTWAEVGEVSQPSGLINSKSDFHISAMNSTLKVSGVNAGQTLEVYNSIGQRLTSMITIAGENNIAINDKGLLIVKVGKTVTKIVM